MNQRTCAECGGPSQTKYCSQACKCGTPIAYREGCRCPTCASAQARRMRVYAAKRRAEGRPIRPNRAKVERVCVGCGVAFSVRADSATRYCTIRCHNLSTRGIDPSAPPKPKRRQKSEVRKRAERRAAKAARGTSGGNLIWVQGRCLVCEKHFPPSPGLASRYCSPECRAVSRRRSSWIGYAARLAIYERDEWTCQICNEAVDPSVDHLDDWSPTLDHIVPRSLGGSDDIENLRTAHRWCNSVRGDLTYYSDVDLAS